MLLTATTTDDGEDCVYFTQVGSVVSYFTAHADGGAEVHIRPGEYACRYSTTAEKMMAVRAAMLEETARRLGCQVDDVERHSLAQITDVCDPLLKYRHTWTGRARSHRVLR